VSEIDRLRWRCRRGTAELDWLLERYLNQRYPGAPESEQQAFHELLEHPDPQLQAWLLTREKPADKMLLALVNHILNP
jgi:antitoxin CptB